MIIKRKIKKSDNDHNIIINLTHEFDDITTLDYENNNIELSDIVPSVIIDGICDSRLIELKKYGFKDELELKYIISTNNNNGIILSKSNDKKITYIIDNILFIDDLENNITSFKLNTNINSGFLNKISFINDKYHGFIDIKIENNLVINRQNISILQDHYRINSIKNVNDFEIYGGGYFNVFKI